MSSEQPDYTEFKEGEKLPMVLVPGDWLARKMGAKDAESVILLRMFLNLVIYSKIVGLIVYFIV